MLWSTQFSLIYVSDDIIQYFMISENQNASLADSMYKRLQTTLRKKKILLLKKGELTINGQTMKFIFKKKGKKPSNGYALFFGFHGGGRSLPEENDSQYQIHKNLYNQELPNQCIWLVPRSCQNVADMWRRPYMEDFLIQIIQAFTIIGEVNPNKVYLTGYSAGGDGVYHMAPRMADWICGAAMMAGHPNEVNLLNIRNIMFSIQVGGHDLAYNRNLEAIKYIKKVNQLNEKYGGYIQWSKFYYQKKHWLDKEDAKVFPWLMAQCRNPYPQLILFTQHPEREKYLFYYIRIRCLSEKYYNQETVVFKNGNEFQIFSNNSISIMVNHKMVDMNQNVIIYHNGIKTIDKKPIINEKIMQKTLNERKDPYFIFEDEFESSPKEEELELEEIKQRKEKLFAIAKEKTKEMNQLIQTMSKDDEFCSHY